MNSQKCRYTEAKIIKELMLFAKKQFHVASKGSEVHPSLLVMQSGLKKEPQASKKMV